MSLDNSSRAPIRDRHRSSPGNMSLDIDIVRGPSSSRQDSLSSDIDFPAKLSLGSVDISGQNLDFSSSNSEPYSQNAVRPLVFSHCVVFTVKHCWLNDRIANIHNMVSP